MSEPSHRRLERATLLLILLAVLAAPFTGARLALYNLTLIALYATVVVSLNLLLGLAGQASFAQTSFMAIGGYGLAIMTTRWHLDPWLAIALSVALALGLAIVIGKPLLRLRGHYLSMGTVALALGTFSFANASNFTNGGWGITGIPSLSIGGFSFRNPLAFYVLGWALCGLSILAYHLLGASYIGRAWRALSTRQDIAAALGIDVGHFKLLAFAISAVMASLAGAFYVAFVHFVGPDLYDISVVLNLMFMLFVGGLRSTAGPIIGAAFVVLVPQFVAGFERYQNLVFFALLLLVILVRPSGLLGRGGTGATIESLLPAWLVRMRKAGP